MNTRFVQFPTDRSLGTLYLRNPRNPVEWIEYCDARGQVAVPVDRNLSLYVDGSYAHKDLSPLCSLAADDLYDISFVSTNVEIKKNVVPHIKHLIGLKGLALWETNMDDNVMAELSGTLNLRSLDIGDTKITNATLLYLKQMPMLETLCMPNTNINEQGLIHIVDLPNLKRLNIAGTQTGDEAFEILKSLNNLQYLSIWETKVSYPVFIKLKEILPDCKIRFTD